MSTIWSAVQGLLVSTFDEVFPPPRKLRQAKSFEHERLEARIRGLAEEVGVQDIHELTPQEQLDVIGHVLRCEQAKNERLTVKYESNLPLTPEVLGKVAFDETNLCIDQAWDSINPDWQAEQVAEAGAVVSAVFVALCRIPEDRLQTLFEDATCELRPFLEAAFNEAVSMVDEHPKSEA